MGWWLRHPLAALKEAWWFVPLALLSIAVFWPSLMLDFILPHPGGKIPPEMIARFREERKVARELAAAELARYEALGFSGAQALAGRAPEVWEVVGRDQRTYRIEREVKVVDRKEATLLALCTVRDLTLAAAVSPELHEARVMKKNA